LNVRLLLQEICRSSENISVSIFSVNIVTSLLKSGIVKPADRVVVRELLCKHALCRQWLISRHMSAATDTHATVEDMLEAVFSVWPVPRLYNEDHLPVPDIRPEGDTSTVGNQDTELRCKTSSNIAYCEIPHKEGRTKGTNCNS
jgi:hypothetical protein